VEFYSTGDHVTIKKALLIVAGSLSLALGIAGIFIPLLPTTPFLLLTAACFSKSSDPLYRWLIHHKLFGKYLRCYRQLHAISSGARAIALILLWLGIGLSAIFVVDALWIRLLLLAIAIGVSIHLMQLNTLSRSMLDKIE
jgi:uncharacterized membrane protein YbaN (DUF454 family)